MDGLGLESLMGSSGGAGDALDANVTIQTEATILQSDTLALRVIKDLNLESNDDFKPKFKLKGWLLGFISPSGVKDPANVPLEDAPGRRTRALGVFSRNLKVKPVSGTRLIMISYTNTSPKVAAAVVNDLIQSLTDFSFQTRYNATSQASEWLGGQLSDLRKQSQDLQAKVVQLQHNSGLFTFGGDGEADGKGHGGTAVYSSVLDQLQQATASLTQAESNRIVKGAIYQAAKSGSPDVVAGIAASGASGGAGSNVNSSLTLLQNLRFQQATIQSQLDEASAKFGPAYPKLEELRGSLSGIQKSIDAELARMTDRAKSDYEISQKVEESARTIFNDQKHDADGLNDKAIEYMIVRQEANQSRTLYENLLGHLKEAGVLEGLRSSNISVIDPARAPSKPSVPNIPMYLAFSIPVGVFLGGCGAIFAELRDNKIYDLRELEMQTGDNPLGVLPLIEGPNGKRPRYVGGASDQRQIGSRAIALQDPKDAYVEALRGLRTSLLLSRGGAPPKTILVTSSLAGEGKTTLSVNLAILLAQQSKRVLLVDADLRRPMIHTVFGFSSASGLSSLLAGHTDTGQDESFAKVPEVPGLHVLCAGPVPPYPSELLGSAQMASALQEWRKSFDFIVFDGAPVLPITDSVILSDLVDMRLLVARYRTTEWQSLERSLRILSAHQSETRPIGIVMNAVERKASPYHEYYGYSESDYHTSLHEKLA
jgi:capsular exopolysaccharide synthesis family protein